MKGVRIEEIARMLGHSDPRVTWRTYAKYSPDYLREAVAALSG
jgi:integrase